MGNINENPEIEINGEKYMDGGISDSIPYMQAIKAGCDKNIVVLTRPKGYVKTQEPATKLVADIIHNAMQKGLLLESCGTASNTIRFLAPLTMTDEQMERGLEIFEESIREALEA